MDMRGKRILITGAARGIGAETADKLAGLGAQIAAVGLEPELLDGVAAALRQRLDRDRGRRLATATRSRPRSTRPPSAWAASTSLMANAGIGSGGTVRTIDPDAFDR